MDAATGAAGARSLSGERATRIVAAMRDSVTEVGIAGSTFERVAAKAGVSRGLLHYYFGTKERLLVDELIAAMSETFERTLREQTGYVYMVSELYVAGRNSPDLQRELGSLYHRARTEFARILVEKEREGVVKLRFKPEATLAYLFAAGDGLTVQRLTDPSLDVVSTVEAGVAVARWLLSSE
jgi:AcrR family transcriptional regulator